MNSSWRRPSKTTALVAVTFSLFIGIFAYAKFGAFDTASRALEVGEAGFRLSPTDFEVDNLDPEQPVNRFQIVNNSSDCVDGICPEPIITQPCADDTTVSCAQTVVAPGVLERGMVLDFSTIDNRGAWIESVDLSLGGSSGNTCETVRPFSDCGNRFASFLDGSSLNTSLLACPSIPGNPGLISDANPTTDDDSNPATDSRYDGPGPFTCSNGDFVIVKSDTRDAALHPLTSSVSYNLTPGNTSAAASVGAYTSTFADGSKVEMVTCVARSDEQLGNNDYLGLSAALEYEGSSNRRQGVPMPQMLTTQYETNNQTTPSCVAMLEPEPAFTGGTNTLDGFAWVEGDGNDIFSSLDMPVADYLQSEGAPRTNVRFVLIANPGTPQQRSKSVYVDDSSNFQFANLPNGDYQLWAINGFGSVVDPFQGTDQTIDSDLTPETDSGDWVGYADFSLSGGQTLTLWTGFNWRFV